MPISVAIVDFMAIVSKLRKSYKFFASKHELPQSLPLAGLSLRPYVCMLSQVSSVLLPATSSTIAQYLLLPLPALHYLACNPSLLPSDFSRILRTSSARFSNFLESMNVESCVDDYRN